MARRQLGVLGMDDIAFKISRWKDIVIDSDSFLKRPLDPMNTCRILAAVLGILLAVFAAGCSSKPVPRGIASNGAQQVLSETNQL